MSVLFFPVFRVINPVCSLQLHTSRHSHWTVPSCRSLFPHQPSRHPHKRLAPPPASRAQGTQEVPLFPAAVSMALHHPAAWWHQQVSLAVGCPLQSQPLFHHLVAWAHRLREVPPRVDSWDSRPLPTILAAQGKAPAATPRGPQSLLKGTCHIIIYTISAFTCDSKSDSTCCSIGEHNLCSRTFCLQKSLQKLEYGWSNPLPPGDSLHYFT